MKLTNLQIINYMNVLEAYAQKKIPQKISYAITHNFMIISKEYQIYESQLKKIFDIYKDHMLVDDDGNYRLNQNGIPMVEESITEEFNEQINDLLNIEIEVQIYTIDFALFDYDDRNGLYDTLSANDILVLQSVLCLSKK